MVAKDVISKPNSRPPASGIRIIERGGTGSALQSWDVKFIDAFGVNVRIFALSDERGIEVADVAGVVIPSAEFFEPKANIEGEILRRLPIILREGGYVVVVIIVIEGAALAKDKLWSALQAPCKKF